MIEETIVAPPVTLLPLPPKPEAQPDEKPTTTSRVKQYGVKPAKAINAAHIQELGYPTPLEFLVKIYADDNIPRAERMDAAKAAAPYVHARLNAIDVNANVNISHEDALGLLDVDDE